MLNQLSNQDFMNPVDDTQYMSQLAQIASMQAMQEMAHRESKLPNVILRQGGNGSQK